MSDLIENTLTRVNVLDIKGFYQVDHIVGEGDMPQYWTADLVGNGYYKAQYQNAKLDKKTGEMSGGEWKETSGPSKEGSIEQAKIMQTSLLNEANMTTSPLLLKLQLGRKLTDEETKKANAWLDYMDLLNAIDLNTAPDIEWPTKPS